MSDPVLVADRYRLDAVLGRGGMGQVWEAHDQMLGRRVAVKEVRWPADLPDHEREVLLERTMREARVTARLNHPGVVTIYDVVSHDGRPFIVMELLAALSLADAVERHGALPPRRVAEIGLEILSALDAAHQQGVVHRDVKPSNVLLRGDGRVVLTDFGIASSDGDANLTATGLLVGSPTYMSPERLRGGGIAPPADLWSLGVTLHTALNGTPPFRGDTTLGTITAVMADPAPDPGVRGPLRETIHGLLDKDPDTRLTSARVRPLLQAASRDEHVSTPPPEPAAPMAAAAGRSGRNRSLVVALAILVLIGGLVTASVVGGDGAGSTDDTGDDRAGAEAAPEETPPADETPEPSPPPEDEEPAGPEVPEGYELRRDPLGFRVAVPQGWERTLDGPTRVDFTSPEGDTLLRVDQIAEAGADAEQAWLDNEPSVSSQLPGYERIRIEPVTYRQWEAADWEFTWDGDNGTVRALNRGIITDPRGFALYVSGPDETWESDSVPVFDAAAQTFRPID